MSRWPAALAALLGTALVAAAPAGLQKALSGIAGSARGRVGAAALLLATGERVAVNGGEPFPMQSVFKMPLGLHVLRLVQEWTCWSRWRATAG